MSHFRLDEGKSKEAQIWHPVDKLVEYSAEHKSTGEQASTKQCVLSICITNT